MAPMTMAAMTAAASTIYKHGGKYADCVFDQPMTNTWARRHGLGNGLSGKM